MAESLDIFALRAGVVETPGFFGDGTGEEGFERADGGEIGRESGAKGIVPDAIFFGADGGLGGDTVTEGVHAGFFAGIVFGISTPTGVNYFSPTFFEGLERAE
jgi:hypothetical protein